MRRGLTAFLATVGLASASPTIFSIHDDIDAFPQYNIVFSSSPISSSEAFDLLESPKTPSGDDSSTIPLEYTRLLLHSVPHLCSIPRPLQEARNLTSEALHKASLALELSRANTHGWELLAPLGESCLYFTSGWWSYQFCYNGSVSQYHASPPQPGRPQYPPVHDPRTPKFVLGRARKIPGYDPKIHGKFYDDGPDDDTGVGSDIELRRLDDDDDADHKEHDIPGSLQNNGDNRYLVQKMSHGTLCDLTMRPREIEIQYHCGANGNDRIAWIKEITTCSYLMVVHTPRLCVDEAFQPQVPTETHEIVCKPITGEEGSEFHITNSASQEVLYSGGDLATNDKASDAPKSLSKENIKDKPLIIGGTVVGGGEYFPVSDPPLLKPPPSWNSNSRNKKPVMVAKSDEKFPGSPDGGKGAANVPGSADSEVLAATLNARLKGDGEVAIEILAHGVGQNDDYQIMTEKDLQSLELSTKVVKGLAEQLRKAAGTKPWTLALVEGEGIIGREIRAVIDQRDDEAGSTDADSWDAENNEWAWEDVEELLFGQAAEDKTNEWKEQEQKLERAAGKPAKGKDKVKRNEKQGGKEEEGSEETYYKDEL